MGKTLFGMDSDNFELFFEKQMEKLTDAGRAAIPDDISGRIFRFDGTFNMGWLRRIPFLGKLWILWRCLKFRVWIVVENEETGLNPEEFLKLRESIKRRDFGVKKAEGFNTQATFITGNKELCNNFAYLNQLCAGPAYNYLNKYKNFKTTKASRHSEEVDYIVRFLRHYESQKKRWIEEKGINIPEWLVLIYLFDKEEALGSEIYKVTFKRAFQSSPMKIKIAFGTLQSKGYILKHGLNSGSRMQITPMGKDLVNYILTNYAANC